MRKTPRVEKREKVKTCYIYQQNPDGHERCHREKEKKRKYQLKETTWKQIKYFFLLIVSRSQLNQILSRAQLVKVRFCLSEIKGNFNCYLFIVKGGFFTRVRFKEKKFVIYDLIGPQFWGKPSFGGKEIAIKTYAYQGLARNRALNNWAQDCK